MRCNLTINTHMSTPEKYINRSRVPRSLEIFIMLGPKVINELSTTSVACELYEEPKTKPNCETTDGSHALILEMSHLS